MRKLNPGKLLLPVAAAAMLAACAASPTQTGMDLGRDRDLDLSGYERVILEPVAVQFDPDWSPTVVGSHLEVSMTDRRRMKEEIGGLFDSSFEEELTAGGELQLVDTAAPRTVRIVPELIDVFLNAPAPLSQPGMTYVRSVGRVTLHLTFYDAASGEQLLELHDEVRGRDIGLLRTASPVYNKYELARIFEDWAQVVRQDIFRAP